jgi:hypothetical protein
LRRCPEAMMAATASSRDMAMDFDATRSFRD